MVNNKGLISLFIFSIFLNSNLGAQEFHKVEPNQTLYSIARLYQITLADLMSWNTLKDARIRPGQVLVIKPAFNLNLGSVGDTYVVQNGDTLESLAARFSLPKEDLVEFNNLSTDKLTSGQRLAVRRPRPVEIYTVQAGDSLLGLSGRYSLSLEELRIINQLNGDSLQVGQSLRVTRPSNPPLTHKVENMDSLTGLALLYGMDKSALVRINNLSGETIYPGQVLKLKEYASADLRVGLPPVINSQPNIAPPTPAPASTHQVVTGDTLYGLSRKYSIPVADLIKWNNLHSNTLKVGQFLNLKKDDVISVAPPVVTTPAPVRSQTTPVETLPAARPRANGENLTWEPFVVLDKDIPLFEWNNDFYYWTHPGQTTQPNRGYYENQWNSPLASYQKAKKLWEGFETLLEKRTPKSTQLKGITIVLDPGHGGLDPGAIVKSTDGLGDTLYITEDEYVYDIALRMVPLLKEHGAQVQLTILSPNHLVRDTTPASRTLIHEKNEIYNSLAKNRTNALEDWPVGGTRGLERRAEVAQELFTHLGGEQVFISLHADNSPGTPRAAGVLFQESTGSKEVTASRFAQILADNLGPGAYTKPRDLGVLRNNGAPNKVLVEVRNVAYQEHAWALRFANSRQMDAQNLVNGILAFYKTR